MIDKTNKQQQITVNLATLGAGQVAYIKKMRSEDAVGKFPSLPSLNPGIDLWALFAADGTPIVLSDDLSNALSTAAEQELATVSLH